MADTPTTRNRFRKPEVGANLNVWGGLLNDTGGSDLVDSSVDGVESYTLSGSKTLTSANYTDSEAIQRVQNITGGTGGTITIPSVEKNYIVRNAASGNVIITTGAGETATILPGNIAQVFTDGSDVFLGLISDYGSVQLKSSATASGPTHLVNKALLDATAFSAALPGQPGNAGKRPTTDGTNASWSFITSGEVTTALGYTPTSVTGLTGAQSVSDFKTGLSINNLDNTSDANKPVSSAQQTALDAKLAKAGGTMTGLLTTVASGTGTAGFNIPHGAAPTSPTNGDIWTTTGGVFARIAGSTQQLALAGGYTQIGTATPTGTATVQFTSIPNTYNELLLVFVGLSTAAAATVTISASGDNDSTRTTIALATTAGGSDTLYGGVDIPGYLKAAGIAVSQILSLTSDTTSGAGTSNPYAWRIAAGINAIRIGSTSNYDAGSVILFAK